MLLSPATRAIPVHLLSHTSRLLSYQSHIHLRTFSTSSFTAQTRTVDNDFSPISIDHSDGAQQIRRITEEPSAETDENNFLYINEDFLKADPQENGETDFRSVQGIRADRLDGGDFEEEADILSAIMKKASDARERAKKKRAEAMERIRLLLKKAQSGGQGAEEQEDYETKNVYLDALQLLKQRRKARQAGQDYLPTELEGALEEDRKGLAAAADDAQEAEDALERIQGMRERAYSRLDMLARKRSALARNATEEELEAMSNGMVRLYESRTPERSLNAEGLSEAQKDLKHLGRWFWKSRGKRLLQAGEDVNLLEESSGDPGRQVPAKLTHINDQGAAHMVNVSSKASTVRIATAVNRVRFSDKKTFDLLQSSAMAKGDVLSVARIAGIAASKRTSDLIPLCHPISLTHVAVDLRPVPPRSQQQSGEDYLNCGNQGGVFIEVKAESVGKTGIEMEALTAASVAALTVYDMCKAVDKQMRIGPAAVVQKSGGKSGDWAVQWWENLKLLEKREKEMGTDKKATIRRVDEGASNVPSNLRPEGRAARKRANRFNAVRQRLRGRANQDTHDSESS